MQIRYLYVICGFWSIHKFVLWVYRICSP